ncbi:peptidase associated domain and porin domain-containing protein [Sphingobacterium wenxiniae]|uniref:CarboxypepD_reg-like domain-containing protein n=1 Tax=Sphingobacterium wenxiniae TaxID=683125 RepID=A0A1I6RB91_9SPHI|nr:TonB-dependent receptor [Sphingobacterium wenxiniae]SFS61982.1 hypothetical protein SAMN05660206_103317 [Sphingobacterium wenxiniae]
MKKTILFLITFLCFHLVEAQETTISGILKDKANGNPIRSASVNIKSSEHKIIAFKVSGADGSFNIKTNRDLTGAYIEVNHLGYKKKQIALETTISNLVVELEGQQILLEDVQVKSRPQVRRIGDTLSYNVGSFAKEEDRSIGEVISRLPGMEVSESGQIKYQGKDVSKMYIDGDDLLEDRYNLGTRTIPHKMVKDIQVLDNHEHLKVLKNKRFTDDVAINLVIKDEAKLKLTGQAKIGAGLPKQYDSEVNTILFNKKFKMLNVIQGNNVGRDLTGDLIGFNRNSTLARLGSTPTNNLLSLGTVSAPPIAKQHYFMNNSGTLNTNNLTNLQNNWQLKSNIQAIYDKNHLDFAGKTDYFTPQQTISFDERQHSDFRQFLAALRFSISKNVDKQFVENNFSFEYEREKGTSQILGNTTDLTASLSHHIRGITNQLQYVPQLKNGNIIQFDWFLNYGNKPQTLHISPGVFPNTFLQGEDYIATIQQFEVPTLFSRISTGYRFPKGKIKQYYSLGLSLEDQKLQSEISLNQNGTISVPSHDSTVNDLHWLRTQYTLGADYNWKRKRLETRLFLPISLQHTQFKDPNYQLNKGQNKILFNPSFQLKYRVAAEDDLSLSYSLSNSFGNIQDIYRGVVIKNYRTLSQNNTDINESKTHSTGLNYRWSRTINLLFANMGMNYSHTKRNAMVAQDINNSISQTILLPIANSISSFSANAGFDKYIFVLASTVKLNASYSFSNFNQLFNQEVLPFNNSTWSLRPQIEAKLWKKINLSYSGTLAWSNSEQKNNPSLNNKVFNLSQNIGLPFHPFQGAYLRISGRHLLTEQPNMEQINYFFVDTFLRFRSNKLKTDFELSLTNLANVKTFETYAISANQQTHNSYQLRGRMGIFKVIFNL